MHVLDFAGLQELLSRSRSAKDVMLTFHSIGDTDAIASAYALKALLPGATIATPDRITSNARSTLDKLGLESMISSKFADGSSLVVMLDVNNFEDCGPFEEKLKGFKRDILIIDHHLMKELEGDNIYIFDNEEYTATSSIVFAAMEGLGFAVDKVTAILLALGILSDSAEFKNSSPLTFEQMGRLLAIAHISYPELLRYMQHIASAEDRASLLTSMFKASVNVMYGLVFVVGFAEHNANVMADNSIKIGADVALFYGISRGEITFSARLRPPLDKEFGLHAGYIMKKLAPLIGGTGGGHPCAAGAYGPNTEGKESFIERFMESIRERVEK
ncbi:MAG: DHH family phosphoesterase [Candidatus Marsarchaeota archaeon]|jgi:nanoRNase/pAp phosphatase (c-di-AMP/oligoRNAs hydrolase)|nr:DHH family phosphoesterase [Candidatus Marsarchaeota archaeon]MCL5418709.1 DHH family phosphoesterase [Candidatus Marsarchaeota archaeon]